MKEMPTRITGEELSRILNVKEKTIKKLVKTRQIPCFFQCGRLYFNFEELYRHFSRLEGSAI